MAENSTPENDSLLDGREEPSAPERPRRSVTRILLSLAAVVPLAVAAGAVATTAPKEPPVVQRAAAESVPGASTHWCQGPLQLPEQLLDSGPDAELAVTPPSTAISLRTASVEPGSSVLFGSVSGSATQQEDDGSVRAPSITARSSDGSDLADQPVSQDIGVSVLDLPATEGPLHVASATSEGGRPVTDSLQSTITPSGDYRSLAVTRCAEPVTEASFLGMSTDIGDSSVLVLHNPTERAATASVQLWTEDGPAAMEGRSQVVVAPGAEERVLLESVAAGQAAVGVDVSVLGSPLVMHVQTTEREGLTPGGAEILSPLPSAETELQMPGVDVAGTSPTLVLANPQGADTTATVEVLGAEGAIETAALEEIEIPAGTVLRTPLDGLPDGTYSVSVRAADPITAVTRSARNGADLPGDTIGAPVDFTLVAPAPALSSHGMSALPIQAGAGELTLVATADSAVTVVPIAADGSAGAPSDVTVNTGATTTLTAAQLQVDGGAAAALSVVPDVPGAVHASWMQRADDGAGGVLLSSLPVLSDQGGGTPVVVRLGE